MKDKYEVFRIFGELENIFKPYERNMTIEATPKIDQKDYERVYQLAGQLWFIYNKIGGWKFWRWF